MPDNPIILKNPPLTQVHFGISFANNLAVADSRNRFYDLVKDDFPHVWIPELTKVTFDFSEYALKSENGATRLEIGMNYFRLATANYPGYSTFKQQFSDLLFKFIDCYAIEFASQLSMTYFNTLPLGEAENFEAYFSIQIRIPDISDSVFAGRGVMVFEEPEGYVSLEIDPQFRDDVLKSYGFIVAFAFQKALSLTDAKESITALLDSGHKHIKRYFFSAVNATYLQHLETL